MCVGGSGCLCDNHFFLSALLLANRSRPCDLAPPCRFRRFDHMCEMHILDSTGWRCRGRPACSQARPFLTKDICADCAGTCWCASRWPWPLLMPRRRLSLSRPMVRDHRVDLAVQRLLFWLHDAPCRVAPQCPRSTRTRRSPTPAPLPPLTST